MTAGKEVVVSVQLPALGDGDQMMNVENWVAVAAEQTADRAAVAVTSERALAGLVPGCGVVQSGHSCSRNKGYTATVTAKPTSATRR